MFKVNKKKHQNGAIGFSFLIKLQSSGQQLIVSWSNKAIIVKYLRLST